ncbi:MAG: peptide ABC transporter substrate-binding protein [Candidatus Dormiibacterota bacterium]
MRLSAFKLRALSLASMAGVLLVACGSSSGQSQNLASDQTLKFPYFQEFGTLDPGILDAEVDSEIAQNIFNGLTRFDNNLTIQPDIATDVPTASNGGVSADGLTYTFHLRKDVTFSNGDKVTSKDVLYSWNRAAALQGPYASNLGAITGFSAVAKATKALGLKPKKPGATATDAEKQAFVDASKNFQTQVETKLAANDPKFAMSGLTAPDDYTVVAKLSSAAGWFLSAITLESTTGMIVDQKVIVANARDWWTKPETLIGTGAFKMTAHTAKQSADFAPVANWWGSPKPVLTKVHMDIHDPSSQSTDIAAWEQGQYDLVGYGGNSQLPKADILRIQKDPNEKSQLTLQPKVRTTWVTFNVNSSHAGKGPFTDQSGTASTLTIDGQSQGINLAATTGNAHDLRLAFALAVDKDKLASVVCSNVICAPAKGGLITKGLLGYWGDDKDPLGKFDASQAKTLLQKADPNGTLTKGIKYSYNTGAPNDDVATFLQDQWQTNLGVKVDLDPHPDASAFISDRLGGKYMLSRDGWQADYNHPQDWYDNLWGAQAETGTSNSSGYDSKTYDDTLAKADGLALDQALPEYQKLQQELSDNAVYIPLYYSVGQFLFKPYLKGAGSNNFFDHYWNEISILQH